jgi:DeoR/GlpR family transcriptional regulator of sugar metabolism
LKPTIKNQKYHMKKDIHLYPAERHQQILTMIGQNGRITVAELSENLGVSGVTIRNDLQTLAGQSLVIRTHGGAVLAPQAPELSLLLRRQQKALEKEHIGAAAANLVSANDAVFLDASSTVLALAQHLRKFRNLTILTHSLIVAQFMLDAPGINVILTGGTLHRDTISLLGSDGLDILRKYNINTGFFGAHGLSFPEGLTDISADEAEIKRGVVAMCRQVVALIDATKWGRVGPASFASPNQINTVITDRTTDASLIEKARRFGMRVIQT